MLSDMHAEIAALAPVGPLTRPRAAPATRHEQRDVTVNGVRLRYIDLRPEKEEDVPVLLIHGLSSRIEEFDELIPHLSARRRVLVPDMPGSGYSDKPNVRYDLPYFEDSLLGFLDAMKVDRCHLAGGSLGGNLVLRLGGRQPERFERLAAWAPAGAWEPIRHLAFFAGIMNKLRFMFWPALWVQSRFWYSPKWQGRHKAWRDAWLYYREVYGPGFHRMYWEMSVDQTRQSLFPHAHRITHPTYLAYGDQDKALGMDRGVQRLAKLIPRVRLRRFDGARHSLANEIPAELGREVDAFLHEKE
jgi:pimeloyl-ACP methyl ester carboxylesterase